MKKLLAIALCVAMLLTTGVVFASATWWTTTAEDFQAVGELKITWDADAANKIKFDGDMSDWAAAEYTVYEIGPNNFVSWVGGSDDNPDPGMPANFSMSTYFVADPHGLYIGFFITDDKPATGDNPAGYNGDAFQIGLDFGYIIGDKLENDPDILSNPKDIFYSFCLQPEGKGADDFQIMRQESDNDGVIGAEDGVKGCTAKTETGWCAEFFMSWERMYADADWKAYNEGGIKVGIGPAQPLGMGCTLYHLGRDTDNGDITWAAGTTKGTANDDGTPSITWTAKDDGIKLVLEYVDGMTFDAEGIKILGVDETGGLIEETKDPNETEPATEPATEKETEKVTEKETEKVTEKDTEKGTEKDTEKGTEAGTSEEGCASVIGGVAIVLAAMAAAVALKKH